MHFSIPDTQELQDLTTSNKYTAFNIHVNGVFHCTVRFKQLYNFHEQLKREYGADTIPPFPPKKLFALSAPQLDERRNYLEKYIQAVSQDTRIQNSSYFTNFFLNAQQETLQEPGEEASIDVFLMNGHKITSEITSTDQTDVVLETICSSISLNDDFVHYFGLFLVKKESGGDNSIVRKLQDFESPFLSLRAANKNGVYRIVLRKCYWDPTFDDDLIDDRVAMNLLYVQAVSDIERGWVIVNKDQHRQLSALQQKSSKKEYLRLARTLKFYGYLQFKPCITDYPEEDSRVIICAGNKQLIFIICDGPNKDKEGSFLVTRMRCWRITNTGELKDDGDKASTSEKSGSGKNMELAIEYLVNKDTLKWITIYTDQAILISMCLQGMVDELMMRKAGKRIRRPQDRDKRQSHQFMKRDGTVIGDVEETETMGQKARDSVKKLSDKITSLNIMGKSSRSASVESTSSKVSNGAAYGGIGDDDL